MRCCAGPTKESGTDHNATTMEVSRTHNALSLDFDCAAVSTTMHQQTKQSLGWEIVFVITKRRAKCRNAMRYEEAVIPLDTVLFAPFTIYFHVTIAINYWHHFYYD